MKSFVIIFISMCIFNTVYSLQSLSKEEREMIQVHSEACMAESHVEPKIIDAFLSGDLIDDTQLKKHVYCILLKCKIIGKDGKLQKAVILGKIPNKFDSKNITKILESCAEHCAESPEEMAWKTFKCAFDKKTVLFNFMPHGAHGEQQLDNN